MKVKCFECGEEIEKEEKEYKRQMKKTNGKSRFFCNLSCTATFRNKNRNEEQRKRNKEHLLIISKKAIGAASKKNYKGQFTYYLRKARSRKHIVDIDNDYLEEIWIKQNGLCAISKIPLIINNEKHEKSNKLHLASLDRIDSSKGYIHGNVRFISIALNYAKSDFSNEEFDNFITTVAIGILEKRNFDIIQRS